MTRGFWRTTAGRVVEEHRCCGFVWQLVWSRLYPERVKAPPPICPKCGARG